MKAMLTFGLVASLATGALAQAEPAAGRLLVVSTDGSGAQIHLLAADGSQQRALTTGPGENVQPAWSPDGRQIVFSSTRHGPANAEIYVMNADGSQPRRLTDSALPDDAPAWSPDGRQIVFRSYRDRHAALYLMNADGSQPRRLAAAEGDKGQPRWSPDGRHIAYERYADLGKIALHVITADGLNDRNLSASVTQDKPTQPVWSPDGRKLAFVGIKSYGEHHIHVVHADGSQAQTITPAGHVSNQPAWSPDGRRIAFVSNRHGDMVGRSAGDIYVMNADGSGAVNLTRHPAADDEPAWSPDGRTVFFLSLRDGPSRLYAIELEGGPARAVSAATAQALMHTHAPDASGGTEARPHGMAATGAPRP